MENKDPLFENFGRNARKIGAPPSSDAWTKLEARLDKHERRVARRRTLPGLGIMSVAASVLLLVGLVFVISQTVLNPSDASMAKVDQGAIPRQVEDLPLLASNSPTASPQMAEYQRKINANPRGIIREGGYHKKLVAQSLSKGQTITTNTDHSGGSYLVTMNTFDWILGDWKSKTKNGTSTESWRSISPGYFKGTGNFTNTNNQSIFKEEMALVERNNKIYFEAVTESAGKKVAYELASLQGNQAIFHNETIEFPSHVVILRTNDGGFSIAFKKIPPVIIPDNSILLENERNSIDGKEIIRKMDRKI